MALSDTSQNNPEQVVHLSELVEKAGITPDQARYAFQWLMENVLVKGNWIRNGEDANLIITVKGADEAERLRMPWWKWYAVSEYIWIIVITGILTTVIGGVIGGVIVGLILKLFP